MDLDDLELRSSGLKKHEKEWLWAKTDFCPSEFGVRARIHVLRSGVGRLGLVCDVCGVGTKGYSHQRGELTPCSLKCANEKRKTTGVAKRATLKRNPIFCDVQDYEEFWQLLDKLCSMKGGLGNYTKLITRESNFMHMFRELFEVDMSPSDSIKAYKHGFKGCASCGKVLTRGVYCSTKCSNADETKQETTKSVFMQKYGVVSNLCLPEVKDKCRERGFEARTFKSKEELLDALGSNTEELTLFEISDSLGIAYSTTATYLQRFGLEYKPSGNRSKFESEIRDFILGCGVECQTNVRSFFENNRRKELDILCQEKKFAVEFDGLYWHKGKVRDFDKYSECLVQGVKLFTIYEDEWSDPSKCGIWKSMLKNAMGLSSTVYARKCEVVELGRQSSKEFFTLNHLQGHVEGRCLGLVYEGEVVAAMSFGKPRWDKDAHIEIYRFCNSTGIRVVGGFSKLLSRLRGTIVSYANCRWSDGKLYESNGFDFVRRSEPNYRWVSPCNSVSYSRMQTQKHRLSKLLGEQFNPAISESENMERAGFVKIYDYGNLVYRLRREK